MTCDIDIRVAKSMICELDTCVEIVTINYNEYFEKRSN